MRINKLQTGGNIYYSAIANPFVAPKEDASTSGSSSKSSSKNLGLISDKLLEKLYEVGIPTDVDEFVQELSAYEQQEQFGLGVSTSAIHALEAKANRIIQNSKYLENAEKFSEKNDAVGEIAVGNYHGRGQLYVVDPESKEIKGIDLTLYDPEKHGPAMTVNELIEHRKFNPSQAFDTSLTRIINSNVGMSKINEYILNIIKTVGSAETTSEAYTDLASYIGKEASKRPTEALLRGLQTMASALAQLGPDAIFKNREVLKSKNILDAFEYIQAVLPKDMLVQLSGRFVAQGGDISKSGNYMQGLIAGALQAANDTKEENYIDYEASLNKAAGTSAGQKEQTRNLKLLDILVQGSLNKIDYNLTSSKNPSMRMTLHGNEIGALTNFDNNIVPKAPMSIALESSLGPLIDKTHITMGTLKISESMFDTILYDGNDVLNVWAPTDSNGDIDLSGLKLFNEILAYFDSDPALSILDKNNILQLYGISGRIDESGNFVGTGNMSQFLVFTGITSDEVLNKDDAFVDVLDSNLKKYELDQIERIYGYLNGKNKNKQGNLEFKKGWFNWSTDIIKAPVFMKLKSTAKTQVGAFGNHGPLAVTPTYQDYVTMDLMRYNQSRSTELIYTPSTNILFLE